MIYILYVDNWIYENIEVDYFKKVEMKTLDIATYF